MTSGLARSRWLSWPEVDTCVEAHKVCAGPGDTLASTAKWRSWMHEDVNERALPRRIAVPGYRGIFENPSKRKNKYEHDYYATGGRRCWKCGFPTIKAAVASREELNVRVRRGEIVAPTRERLHEYAPRWLAGLTHLRLRTVERYEINLRCHVLPLLGHLRLADLNEDHFVRLRDHMVKQGYSGWTIRQTQGTLSKVLGHASRRGLIASNPATRLERGERAAVLRREPRVLSREEISALLAAASVQFRTLLATAVFSGMRLGELQGLLWREVDFASGFIRVRQQLDRDGRRSDPKTPQAKRDIVLMPALGTLLKHHRLASSFSAAEDYVFASRRGTPLAYRNIERRGLHAAADSAGLNNGDGARLRMHDLRHTFASLLIAQGADVVAVSRQLGHASPDITLKIYAHLFDAHRNAERTRALLEDHFGDILASAPLAESRQALYTTDFRTRSQPR